VFSSAAGLHFFSFQYVYGRLGLRFSSDVEEILAGNNFAAATALSQLFSQPCKEQRSEVCGRRKTAEHIGSAGAPLLIVALSRISFESGAHQNFGAIPRAQDFQPRRRLLYHLNQRNRKPVDKIARKQFWSIRC
jgi:hypothetical protein